MASRNLILGAATGYRPDQVGLFVRSLAKINFAGRLVLFIYGKQMAPMQDFLCRCAPGLDVELVRVAHINEHGKRLQSFFKRLLLILPAEASMKLKSILLRFYGRPHAARYFHYAAYLDAHPEFAQVLLTDTRDVVFQSDPFRDFGSGLSVSMESAEFCIATESFNREWILDAYGEAMLQSIGQKQVSCSGVTLGDAAAIRRYVDLILREARSMPFARMKLRLHDQAFHNKLLHCGELDVFAVERCQPFASRIATLAVLEASSFSLSAAGQLLNADGSVAPIVHQYDRHPMLVSAFEKYLSA